jgi:hypothetical protein
MNSPSSLGDIAPLCEYVIGGKHGDYLRLECAKCLSLFTSPSLASEPMELLWDGSHARLMESYGTIRFSDTTS